MRTVFKFCAGTIAAASLFLEGCDRHSSNKQEEGTRIQPGGIAEESAQWGYLALIITRTEPERNSQLFVTSTAEPTKRTLLTEFEGSVLVQEHVPAAQGTTMLVTEMLHQKAKTI